MPARPNRSLVVRTLLGSHTLRPAKAEGAAFAPSNIALAKYWASARRN
jgi:hypothetical protein